MNRGIFRFHGDELCFCIDNMGKIGPRRSRHRPAADTRSKRSGGNRKAAPQRCHRRHAARSRSGCAGRAGNPDDFKQVPSDLLSRLQGEWLASMIVRDGMKIPSPMLKLAKRSAKENQVKITMMGQTIIHVSPLRRVDDSDRNRLSQHPRSKRRASTGHLRVQRGGEACFCMAAPGQPRPTKFEPGAGITLSMEETLRPMPSPNCVAAGLGGAARGACSTG